MFVRSLLATSLCGIFASSAVFAASSTEQPLKPKIVDARAIQDPIDPLAITPNNRVKQGAVAASSPASSLQQRVTSQERDLNAASSALQNLEKTEDLNSDIAASPASGASSKSNMSNSTATKAQTPVAQDWSINNLNNVSYIENLGRGQFPMYARAHVMLNNAHASPGAIDGSSGMNTLKAIASFQQMNGLKATGELTQETWDALLARQDKPAFVEYTITTDDLKGPYAKSIPVDYALQAKMKGLYYTSVLEMFGERFHMDEAFLKLLNPKATFNKAGEKIIVANVRNDLPEDIHLIIAVKGAKQLYLFNNRNQMIASFPATIGSTDTPSPTGTYKITGVAKNPWYSYSPSNFIQGNNLKPLSLPPGPNAPVGNIWIGLSKKSFGIHGTPNPSSISKSASHGCIRLTNWDANDLGDKVRSGVTVKFLE